MAPSSSSMMLMAGSALLVSIAASQFFPSSSKGRGGISEIDEEDEDYITADEVAKIFDRLFLDMQQIMAALSQQIQQIQMSGQQIPESQLKGIIKAEIDRNMMQKQAKVFEDFNVDADCLEEATWEFMGQEEEYPNVVRAVERFQKLYEQVTGQQVTARKTGDAKPAEILSKESLLQAAEAYFGALTEAMKEVVDGLKAEGKDISTMAGAQEAQMKFQSVANESGENALESIGVTTSSFQASIEKHASDPQVGRTLQMLQMKQQQDIMAMGFPM